MTRSRVQTNRNVATGAKPSTGTRKPGELYVNHPDLQLGVIDQTQAPQDLLAVRFFSTAANYSVGAFVVYAGALYAANTTVTAGAFNPAQWTASGAGGGGGGSGPPPSTTTPAMDGVGAAGAINTYARGDHVHPSDTSRYAASNPNGYQTAAQVTASLAPYVLAGASPLSIGNGSGDAYVNFNVNSGAHYASFNGQVLGTNRWAINFCGVPSEAGSNSGSDFNLIASNDAGAQIGSMLMIKRSNGQIVIAMPTNAANDTAAASAGVPVGGLYRNGSVLMVRVT